MSRAAFVPRMAAREIRAAPRRLLVLTASVAIGVAALVAIGSFADNLRASVRGQRALRVDDEARTSDRVAQRGWGVTDEAEHFELPAAGRLGK